VWVMLKSSDATHVSCASSAPPTSTACQRSSHPARH
jgi:hypothetical protein